MKRYPLKRWDDTDMGKESEAPLWGDISFTVFGRDQHEIRSEIERILRTCWADENGLSGIGYKSLKITSWQAETQRGLSMVTKWRADFVGTITLRGR